jgi:hypothetical protein
VRIVRLLPRTRQALAGAERERTQRRGSTCVRIVRLLELSENRWCIDARKLTRRTCSAFQTDISCFSALGGVTTSDTFWASCPPLDSVPQGTPQDTMTHAHSCYTRAIAQPGGVVTLNVVRPQIAQFDMPQTRVDVMADVPFISLT